MNLYNLRIKSGNRTAVIRTTSNHPFWVPAANGHPGQWATAATLTRGTRLHAPSATATVLNGWTPRQRSGWMWDLTVPGNNDHDFYVAVAATAILVHNCGSADLNYNQISQRIDSHVMPLHGYGTLTQGTKFAENLDGNGLFTGLLERIRPSNETGISDALGNHEHIIPWPGAGANGENFVRAWMTPNGELGGMWPITGP